MALFRRALDRLRFWRWYVTEFRPIAGAEDEPEKGSKADPDPEPAKGGDSPKGVIPDPDPDPEKVTPDDDWKAKARKHERAEKRARKEAEEAARKLKDREDADKSEQEKAIEKAREEAKAEAKTEGEKERRADRLDVAVTRLAAKGITIGEGDEAKSVKFADADDALANVERGIARGDIDADDIYDDEGKVKTDALTAALREILDAKPHLAAGDAESAKPSGDPDARKGDPASKDLEAMSPEDHAKRKYGEKK
jgi:hypothetical protein